MFIPNWRRRASFHLCLVVAASLIVAALLGLHRGLRETGLELVRPAFFYVTGLTRYDFKPTPDEQACLDGTAVRINAPNMPSSIPRVAHFITGVDRPNPATLVLWLAVRAAAANLGPDGEIRLHYLHLSDEGPWWSGVRKLVTLVRHEPGFLDEFARLAPSDWDPAHKADVLRLQILRAHGGIYLDTDAIILRPLDRLLSGRRDVVLAHEGGNRRGMTNAVILAKRGAPFLERWYRMYDGFNPRLWNYHSVVLPARLADRHAEEVCQLSPAAFFWPLWPRQHIEWMHAPLSPAESATVAAAIARNNGSLFGEQLINHAWNHPAARFVRHLTPERIKTEDTRFNMLVRRFVDVESRI
ncbi:glycosyltransferase sugar-binding domain-containing protein [Hirsutella rhossiliensis]|uniref:Glycosyltransferase sugar-binding domain-containing protein n=1 Tax=Hirsutella rhossiliensis TaxID=111463 RepID=A0A9P8SGS8_9HYPO|nr:glycosyltransferase sugar-binding domain-containing protein [Hirsutella rhossiliensis]KAH0962388.1 glycosyltransferase sugar-binding domain-containing protein [Hirsutella rhossiliensis]